MKKFEMSKAGGQQGFTLIELSIVLVIIGLIVGGVLVGQDLIKAAQLRAAINQINSYDTAVNTFQAKYNGIPGDLSNPVNFGFDSSTSANAGNGVLDNSDAGVTPTKFDMEPAAFWRHLYQANLISENIAGGSYAAGGPATRGNYVPASKLGQGAYLMALSTGGVNYYLFDNMTLAAGVYALVHTAISPLDAYSIDSKMDDGLPATGKVNAVATNHATLDAGTAGGGSGVCVNTTTAAYNTSSTANAIVGSCALRIRASF